MTPQLRPRQYPAASSPVEVELPSYSPPARYSPPPAYPAKNPFKKLKNYLKTKKNARREKKATRALEKMEKKALKIMPSPPAYSSEGSRGGGRKKTRARAMTKSGKHKRRTSKK